MSGPPPVSAPRSGPPGAPSPAISSGGATGLTQRDQAIGAARALIGRSLRGTEREDLLSLLDSAESIADEGQRYQAYLGAWQYMRLIYLRQSDSAELRATLDVLEAVARTFPQYTPAQFQIQKSG